MPDIGQEATRELGRISSNKLPGLDVFLARLRSRTDETGGIGHVRDWFAGAILFGADNPRMF